METNLLATDILQKVSIPFRNGFIMFHPYSTLKEYKNNIGFINCIHQGYRLGNYLEMFLLYKGCDLYTKVKKDNLITDDYTIKNLYGYTFQDPQISCLYNIFQTVLKTHRTTTYMGVKFIERCDVLDDMIAKLDILSQGENFDLRQQFINIKTKVNEEYYQYFDMVYNFVNSKKDCEICYTPISKRTLLDGIADLDALTLYIENKLAIYPSFL